VVLFAPLPLHQGIVGEDKWEKVNIYFVLFTEAFDNYDGMT
jgi:hypothetical protein